MFSYVVRYCRAQLAAHRCGKLPCLRGCGRRSGPGQETETNNQAKRQCRGRKTSSVPNVCLFESRFLFLWMTLCCRYYQSEQGAVPVLWTAPEALDSHKVSACFSLSVCLLYMILFLLNLLVFWCVGHVEFWRCDVGDHERGQSALRLRAFQIRDGICVSSVCMSVFASSVCSCMCTQRRTAFDVADGKVSLKFECKVSFCTVFLYDQFVSSYRRCPSWLICCQRVYLWTRPSAQARACCCNGSNECVFVISFCM